MTSTLSQCYLMWCKYIIVSFIMQQIEARSAHVCKLLVLWTFLTISFSTNYPAETFLKFLKLEIKRLNFAVVVSILS